MLLDEQLFKMTGRWAWGWRAGTELI